jgi:peptidyl-prolyl cis-trans isomerase SurA
VRASALEELIEGHLLARVVKQAELTASDADIDKAIEGIAKENGLTVEQLQASVTSHDITYKEYREQIKHELERRKVVQSMIASKVRVEEDDLRRLYAEQYAKQPAGGETVHVRQILVVFGGPRPRPGSRARRRRASARGRPSKRWRRRSPRWRRWTAATSAGSTRTAWRPGCWRRWRRSSPAA